MKMCVLVWNRWCSFRVSNEKNNHTLIKFTGSILPTCPSNVYISNPCNGVFFYHVHLIINELVRIYSIRKSKYQDESTNLWRYTCKTDFIFNFTHSRLQQLKPKWGKCVWKYWWFKKVAGFTKNARKASIWYIFTVIGLKST